MKHSLQIGVSKKSKCGGIVSCGSISVRERILRFLFGRQTKLTIVIPGDSVQSVSIDEVSGGEKI